jgi:hypothetical protein
MTQWQRILRRRAVAFGQLAANFDADALPRTQTGPPSHRGFYTRYAVVINKGANGFDAYVPDVPGG